MCNYCKGLVIGILLVVIVMLIVQIILFTNEQKCTQKKITAEIEDNNKFFLKTRTGSTFCVALIWTERALIILLLLLLILLMVSTCSCSQNGGMINQNNVVDTCTCNGCPDCLTCNCKDCDCQGCSECKHCLCKDCYCQCGSDKCRNCYVEEDEQVYENEYGEPRSLNTFQYIDNFSDPRYSRPISHSPSYSNHSHSHSPSYSHSHSHSPSYSHSRSQYSF